MSSFKPNHTPFIKAVVALALLYHIGILDFLGVKTILLAVFYLLLGISLLSWTLFIKDKRVTWFDIALIVFCFGLPILCSVQSLRIFDQPITMGLVSMRYGFIILFGYLMYLADYDYRLLLKQVNTINLAVACISIVALCIFKIDSTNISSYMVTTETVESIAREDMVKGRKLTVCSELMFISYIYYLLKFLSKPSNVKYLLALGVLMIYLVFIHKGRQPLVATAAVYIFYCCRNMGHMSKKKLLISLLPLLAVPLVLFSGSGMLDAFLSIFGIGDIADSSTLARLESLSLLVPYIKENLLLGFGNLSYHFGDNGFHQVFNSSFYLSDLGLVGVIAMGGLFLVAIYAFMYVYIWKKSKRISSGFFSEYSRYMIIFCITLLVLGNDILFAEKALTFALIYYPFFGSKAPDVFFSHQPTRNDN